MGSRVRSVAIVGAGPAGAALACHLGRAGARVALFDRRSRPPVVVGESLVPATVPFLRELGIEDEVRAYSTFKEGATFVLGPGEVRSFRFDAVRGARTRYAYNVPRDRFDASLAGVAERSGARIVRETARLERLDGTDRVVLAPESLAAVRDHFGGAPDLIVDAGGRARLLPNLLRLPHRTGSRRDTALFAHCDGISQIVPGDVHIDRLEHGWSWRIPLPDRTSVGFVVDSDHLRTLGSTAQEQFDAHLRDESLRKAWGGSPRRVTPVLKFTAYQLITSRATGDGWALCGDTFGFVDPVFSSGLLLAFDGARALAKAIAAGGDRRALQAYERHVRHHLSGWHRTIEHWYDGRLFTLFRVGERMQEKVVGRVMDFHFRKHLPRVFTGEASRSRYSVGLVDFMCRHGLLDHDPAELAIR